MPNPGPAPLDANQELLALRRQVREMADELAEWKAIAQPGAGESADLRARFIAFRLAPGSGGAQLWGGRLLAFLLEHPGIVHTRERLLPYVAVRDLETYNHVKTVHVAICQARAMLTPHGLRAGIENHYGLGYRMTPACAAAVKAILAERPEAGADPT